MNLKYRATEQLTSKMDEGGVEELVFEPRARLESVFFASLALTFRVFTASFLFTGCFCTLRDRNLFFVAGEGGVKSSTDSGLVLSSSSNCLCCSRVKSFLILSFSIFCIRWVSRKRSFAISQVSLRATCSSFSCSSSRHTKKTLDVGGTISNKRNNVLPKHTLLVGRLR